MAVNFYLQDGYRRIRGMYPELNENNRLMFITHRTPKYTECDEARMVLEGGCSWIQLRMKEGIVKETAHAVYKICQETCERKVDLCIDDDVWCAVDHCATAVHLGKKDLPIPAVWEIIDQQLGPDERFYVGATANTFADIQKAVKEGASYIGLGPYRFTKTKQNLSPILGLEGYRTIVKLCREAGYHIPIFAIGGIELDDVRELMQTGIAGIAVSGAILQAPNPVEMTRAFICEINTYHKSDNIL